MPRLLRRVFFSPSFPLLLFFLKDIHPSAQCNFFDGPQALLPAFDLALSDLSLLCSKLVMVAVFLTAVAMDVGSFIGTKSSFVLSRLEACGLTLVKSGEMHASISSLVIRTSLTPRWELLKPLVFGIP